MKNIFLLTLVIGGLLVTSCQNEMTLEERNQTGIYTLVANMGQRTPESRAQIQLGRKESGGENMFWNKGDQFALYQKIYNQIDSTVFSISDYYVEPESGSRTDAEFVSNTPASVGNFVAVYPANVAMENEQTVHFPLQHDLDFTDATTPEQMAEVWKQYMRDNMYMMAKGTVVEGQSNILQFKHLCTLFRITLKNETSVEMQPSSFILGGIQYLTSISHLVDPYLNYISGRWSTNMYQVNTKGLKIAPGDSTDVYIYFFPSGFEDNNCITIKVGGYDGNVQLYGSEISAVNNGNKEFEAGKRYWFKLSNTDDGITWSNEKEVVFEGETITIENPGLSKVLFKIYGRNFIKLNEEGNAIMLQSFAENIKALILDTMKGIETLDGIEYFTNLETLSARHVGLKSVDVSKNKALKNLDLTDNPDIQELDLSENVALEVLQMTNMPISSIDLSKNVNLTGVLFVDMPITQLDLTNNLKLNHINCRHCKIAELDITPYTLLKDLYCGGQQDNIMINVYMTEKQKELWDSDWYSRWENANVNPIVKK